MLQAIWQILTSETKLLQNIGENKSECNKDS